MAGFKNSKLAGPCWLLGAILAGKVALAFIDHEPRFFLGDSASYLATAVDGWIPPDRSFLYGFFIRWVAMPFQDIEALITAQVFLSALTVWIGVEIVRRAGFNNRVLLWGLGIIWVVAPIQLVYERFKTGNPPSYHSRQGYFMLATVAPLLSPSDFADPGLRAAVYAEGGLDLEDPALREEQVWNGDGLLKRMERYIGDPIEVDQLARKTAFSVILRHPVEFISLGWVNAKAYLQPQVVSQMVRLDLNRDRPLFGEFEAKLIESFSYTGDWKSVSVTTVSFFRSIPCYVFLVGASLPLVLVAIAVSFSRARLALFVAGHLFVAFGVVMWLAVTATVRYLHTIEFLFLFTLGLTMAELMAKGRQPGLVTSAQTSP